MLPSLLAREIQNVLKHFLKTGCEPSERLFAGNMQRFTDDESRWLKGPRTRSGCRSEPAPGGGTFSGVSNRSIPATSIRKRRGIR